VVLVLLCAGLAIYASLAQRRLNQPRAAGGTAEPPRGLSRAEKVAAGELLGEATALRGRFVALSASAERREQTGDDMARVRNTLGHALLAAAKQDRVAAAEQLDLAERTLDSLADGVGSGANAVAALAHQIEPGFLLGQELMTEGQVAVEKLVCRASRLAAARQPNEAAVVLGVAAQLLGVSPVAGPETELPRWFVSIEEAPAPDVNQEQAQSLVSLCEATASAEEPSRPVAWLVDKARREFDAGRPAQAHWWASVALNALGLSDVTGADTE